MPRQKVIKKNQKKQKKQNNQKNQKNQKRQKKPARPARRRKEPAIVPRANRRAVNKIDKLDRETLVALKKVGGNVLSDIIYSFPEKYKVERKLGAGLNGVVFLMRSAVNYYDSAVIKVISSTERGFDFILYLEFLMQRLFAHYGLTIPSKVLTLKGQYKNISNKFSYNAGRKKFYVIVMSSITGTIIDKINSLYTKQQLHELTAAILSLIVKISQHNLTHGDLHDENVAIIVEGAQYLPVAIDFGWSMYGVVFPRIDLIQFIRGLFFARNKKKNNKNNIDYMITLLLDVYTRRYNRVQPTFNAVEREFMAVFNIYERNYQIQVRKLKSEYDRNGGKIPSIERILRGRSVRPFKGNLMQQDDSTYIYDGFI